MFPFRRGIDTDERIERLFHGSFGINSDQESHSVDLTSYGQLKEVEKLASKKGVGASVGFISLCAQFLFLVADHDWI